MEQDVGEEFEAAVQMFGERGGVDTGFLLGSEGVEFAAYAVNTVADVVRTAVFGAFEEGVLDEMGHPFVVTAFVAAAADAYLSGMGTMECARRGLAAAAICAEDPEAVSPEMSQEAIEMKLSYAE